MSPEITHHTYEMALLFRPDLSELDLQKAIDKVKASLVSKKGEIIKESSWGKKQLAYPIQKEGFGFYHTIISTVPGDSIEALMRELHLSPDIMRYMIISLEKEGVTFDQLFTPAKEEAYASVIMAEKMAPKFKPREAVAKVEEPVKKAAAPKIAKKELDEKIEELLTKDIE